MEAQHIVIAEADPNMQVSLEYLMKREGHVVHLAADGMQALQLVQSLRPQLLLLEVQLPGKNGFEVCQALRAQPEWAGLRILFLSARAEAAEVAKGLALGADGYLTKPFSTRSLAHTVAQLLHPPARAA